MYTCIEHTYKSLEFRISYFEFLKPFAVKKQIWRYGNDMLDLLKHGLSPDAVISDREKAEEEARANAAVIERLRSKVRARVN